MNGKNLNEMIKTIVSGIDKLSSEIEKDLSKLSAIEYRSISNNVELKNALNSCDVFWFRLNHRLTKEILDGVKCRYILCAVTGLDHIDLNECKRNDIEVISLKNEFDFLKEVRATAEHTICLILSLIRKTKKAFSHVESGKWNRYLFQGTELYKKRIGILGLGRLGKIVASYCETFGMEIYYYDIDPSKEFKNGIKSKSIYDLVRDIDILTIHLPYNENTHDLIGRNVLGYMKSSSIIINTSRGGIINEKDLSIFLLENRLSGYATDVLFNEPNIEHNVIAELAKSCENVIITPHIAGNTYESIEKTELFVFKKLLEHLKR